MAPEKFILTIGCPETTGIVRDVSDFFYQIGGSIVEAAQYTDSSEQRFFARWEVAAGTPDKALPDLESIQRGFLPVASRFSMEWNLVDAAIKPKILIAVSRIGHCLNDLLYRWHEEEFPADIVGVVSNHRDYAEKTEWYGLPFFHLPVSAESRKSQEQEILKIMSTLEVDLLVLARYMQILSDEMCRELSGRAINIHHSFLPSFKGARPYHQAFERGVKVTGATAHYVTSELDEGPIIEQDVQRVEHNTDIEKLISMGKSVESVVLSRAVIWHCQQRVLLNGHKTIVFK